MNKKGFTLLELLVVVGIISILASIALPNFRDATVRSRIAQVKMDLRTMGMALDSYRMDHSLFPRRDDQLLFFAVYLLPDLTSPVSYLNSANVKDPFGLVQEYVEPSGSTDGFVVETLTVVRNSYTYTPYFNFAYLQRIPELRKEGYALASVGPDRQDSYIIDYPFPGFYRIPGDSNRDSVYNPSNGVISPGDIGYFGGDLNTQGLIGG